MTNYNTAYPQIGAVSGERGGVLDFVVDPAHLVAPTATFTALMTAGSIGVGFIPGGYFKVKFSGTVYRVPLGTNA